MDPNGNEWELSKENVKPRKSGRLIPSLNTAALTPCSFASGSNVGDDSLYWKHQKDKQNFEAEIRTYEGDDFLDIWYRYILWTEENLPKGGREIGTLLERCIKEFQDVTKYENDERYLNVWLKYADCCTDPLEIFNYLHMKGTCSHLATLYIAWASACENVESFKKADEVLLLGIEKNAEPVETLQKHHIGFQHRLTAHIAASEEKSSTHHGKENPRKALGFLMSSGKMVGVIRSSSSQNPSQSRSVVVNQERKGLGFTVLHDSDENEKRISQLPEGRGSDWKEVPTESTTSKENVNMPGKWTGEQAHPRRIPGKNILLVRRAPKQSFQVHVDENAEQIGHVSQAVGNQVLSVRKSDLEASNNPLKIISKSVETSGPSNERPMYDKSKVYAGGEEFQFEEIRAAKYMALLKQGLPLPKKENRSKSEREPEKKERVMYQKDKVYAYEGEFQLEELMARLYYSRGKRLRVTREESSQSAVSSKMPLADLSVAAASNSGPSPTLMTKEAFADVMSWFNTTIGVSTSDDELEKQFKNDENDDGDGGMGWDGIPFGEAFAHNGLKRKFEFETREVDNWNEDQENLPPFGYCQTTVKRSQLGVLQPAVGIPFEPLQEFEKIKDEVAGDDDDDERLKKVCSGENTVPLLSCMKQEAKHEDDTDMTTRWLNHSQFAAAARMMSTPFTESLCPPKFEDLHCSRIQTDDEGQGASSSIPADGDRKDASQQDQESSISRSPHNVNTSKGLSPILECSDEYGRASSSKTSSHSSGHKSFDITVHDITGSVLKKINPFDPNLCNQLLAQLVQPVSRFGGYHDLTEELLPTFSCKRSVMIGKEMFKVNSIAGSGAYAKVYSATKGDATLANTVAVALKVQRPANEWEFYICSELERRMREHGKSESEIASVVRMTDYYVFADGSCGVADYHKNGTFLDFVNDCWKHENGRQERTALYYAIEIMTILECIHDCGIIHGDIKPDNFVLLENIGDEGMCRLGLIDFGCAIDVNLFPTGTRFTVEKNTESFECIEMKTQRPWTTQVDTYGMLSTLHCMVFSAYMKVYEDKKTGRWRSTKSFSRTWNRALWNKLFDMFLNTPSCDNMPSLAAIREEFQEYFDRCRDE